MIYGALRHLRPNRKLTWQWMSLVIALFVVGCATPVTKQPEQVATTWLKDGRIFADRYRRFDRIEALKLSARVAFKSSDVSESANLSWRSNPDSTEEIDLFGPLGIGAVNLQMSYLGAVLKDGEGQVYADETAEALLLDVVGWDIPVRAMKYWLYAVPQPGRPYYYSISDTGEIQKLRQLGWDISYRNFVQQKGESIPTKLIATKLDDHTVQVKISLKQWSAEPSFIN